MDKVKLFKKELTQAVTVPNVNRKYQQAKSNGNSTETTNGSGRQFLLKSRKEDVMHEVLQGAKVDQWTMVPRYPPEIQRYSYVGDDSKIITKPIVPQRIQANTEISTTNAESSGSEISEEKTEPQTILVTEETTIPTHVSHKKKKTTRKERKKKMETPARWQRNVPKKVLRKKLKKNTSKKKLKIKTNSASEHDDEVVTRGKPVDIVVHIKMADK